MRVGPMKSMRKTAFVGCYVSLVLTLLAGCASRSAVPSDPFAQWPAGASPQEIGRRVAENWAARRFEFETSPAVSTLVYPEACTWYGALTIAHRIGDADLQRRLIAKFEPFLGPEAARIDRRDHVDYRVFGIVPLELYRLTHDAKYLAIGRSLADAQWQNPTADGITHEARTWIDDMYMITALQVQAYRATGDPVYLDRAALTLTAYLERLQQPNGLFFHTPDSPFFWGRGNGWVAAGLTELLRALPPEHPRRPAVLAGYHKMMAALLAHQGRDGMWRQLIDKPEAWPESSSTAMFTFALAAGVQHGWLDRATYGPAARRAWLALVSRLDENANIRDVCVGTDKGSHAAGPDLEQQYRYYLARGRRMGDLHGQAPLLWAAAALLPAESR